MRLRFPAREVVPFLLTVAVLLATVGPALAAAPASEKKDEGGLAFLDLHRYDLGIFTLIVFGLLCLILWRFAWPKINEGLAKREAAIAAAREEAIRARHEAEEIRSKLQAEFAKAHDQVRTMIEEARRDAEVLRAKEREAGEREAAAERERARREIDAAKDAALQEIYQRAVQLAGLMATKAVRRQLTPDDQGRLIEESLTELQGAVSRS